MEKVLIIEDDWTQRVLYELEISEMGYEVILAKDGLDAAEKFCRYRPDLVLLDLRLPDKEGLDVLRKLFNANPTVPVIIHSAYSDYKDNPICCRATAYIIKSSDLTELKNALMQALNSKKLQ